MRPEDRLAIQLSDYIAAQYPNIVAHFDLASGGVASIGMAMRNKRLNKKNAYPDLFIAEPKEEYSGLYIEIKATSIFKKDGTIKKDKHLQEQRDMLCVLTGKGYYATFGCGFDDCKKIIDEYLNLK